MAEHQDKDIQKIKDMKLKDLEIKLGENTTVT